MPDVAKKQHSHIWPAIPRLWAPGIWKLVTTYRVIAYGVLGPPIRRPGAAFGTGLA